MAKAFPQRKKKQDGGGGWIVTFADLMSLLLTFFILLLSFSKMDLHKYEMMAQSLAESFGPSFLQGSGKAGGEIIFAEEPPPAPPVEEMSDLEQEFQEFESESGQDELEMLEQSEGESDVISIDPNIEQLTETLVEELEAEINKIISDLGANGMKDMGKVMGVAMKNLGGKADGSKISSLVKALLS